MSNPARRPTEPTKLQLAMKVAPDAYLPEGYANLAKSYKKVEKVLDALAGLDMEDMPTFVVPKTLTLDERIKSKSGPALALAKTGVPAPRIRSKFAKMLVNAAFNVLPESGPFSKGAVGSMMEKRVYVDAGVEGAVGRLVIAYPRRGVVPRRPVTPTEARMALERCGLDLSKVPSAALRKFPLLPKDGEQGISVNPKSDNGFPVLAKWETDGAAQLCMQLAVTIELELRREGVDVWFDRNEKERPYLVAVRGKAKADYYAQEKVSEARMRFYNAFPRQMLLIMQQATQVLEMSASHIQEASVHSGIGITLVRKGAQTLVDALQAQLDMHGFAYVHVGDDSWVVVQRGKKLAMFALDCSNFDLTQHDTVTKEVHVVIARELARIDKVASQVWFRYARSRVTVLVGSVVKRLRHAGPSGMPLQSKVNDVLMEVMVRRTMDELGGEDLTEEAVSRIVADVGSGMGFVVRLEQYWEGMADGLMDALQRCPFLFIGYYFGVRKGGVQCFADVPRTFAQVPYPSVKWALDGNKELRVMEAMRLGSIAMNLGMPPIELEEAFSVFRAQARDQISTVLADFGDQPGALLRWVALDVPWAAEAESSLEGLFRALTRDPSELWLEAPAEMVSTSVLVPLAWADIVEEEEEGDLRKVGLTAVRPTSVPGVRAMKLPHGVVATHPVTRANAGRPAPTAVWAPDKPKAKSSTLAALENLKLSRRSRRRDGIAFREFHEALLLQEGMQWAIEESDDELL